MLHSIFSAVVAALSPWLGIIGFFAALWFLAGAEFGGYYGHHDGGGGDGD